MPEVQDTRDAVVEVLPVLRHAASDGAQWESREGIRSCPSNTTKEVSMSKFFDSYHRGRHDQAE